MWMKDVLKCFIWSLRYSINIEIIKKIFMKKIYLIQIIFTMVNTIAFAQLPGYNNQLNIYTSCTNAKLLCGEKDEGIQDSIMASKGCSIDDQYFKFYSNSNGNLSIYTINTGSYTLYGPFDGFGSSTCAAIEGGQANAITAELPPTTQIPLDSGYYILRVKIDCIGPEGNSIAPPQIKRYINIKVYGRSITCDFPPPKCIDCISSFSPDSGEYILSGWVKGKEENINDTYVNPEIQVALSVGGNPTNFSFSPSGIIIDGWQRIDGKVTIPQDATQIEIMLNCISGDCYFDDIRFVPIDGSMKSYVYDPITLKLVAELDERNYATFYEYDEEGKLIRVKKETEKGIMTIKENRDNISK